MLFLDAWDRPSTWMLVGLLTANLLAPVVHFWPDGARAMTAHRGDGATGPAKVAKSAVAALIEPFHPALPKRRLLDNTPAACLAWGPFTAPSEAESMAGQLHLDPSSFDVFETQVRSPPDYLVTVRAGAPRDGEKRMLRALAREHVDSYVMERGPDGSVLAAGVFSTPERAESQRRRLTALGYQAAVKRLDKSHDIYHLLARVPADIDPKVPAVAACDDIAPLKQFL